MRRFEGLQITQRTGPEMARSSYKTQRPWVWATSGGGIEIWWQGQQGAGSYFGAKPRNAFNLSISNLKATGNSKNYLDSNQSNLLTRSDWKIRCGSRQEVLKLNLHTARSYHLESAHHLKAIYCRDGPVRLTTNIEQWSITRWIDIWIVDTSQAITYLQYNDCSTGFVIVRAIVLVLFFHLSGSHVMYSLLSCQRYDWIKSVKALWFWSFNNAAQSRSFVLVTTPITVLDRQPRMQPLKNPLLRIHCQSLHRYQKAATFVQALARNRRASESNKCPQS